jgi:septal ring factor EnvC (AmiA/AmiB activator)
MLLPVNDTNYLRDTTSMALINNDRNAKEEYFNKSKMIKQQKEEINTLKTEIMLIKTDVTDIKELLKQLIGKGKNG